VLPVLLGTRQPPARPIPARALLLLTIVLTFVLGAVIGASLTFSSSRWSMLIPAVGILAASALAFFQRREPPKSLPAEPVAQPQATERV
jgi:hypothetical protein